MTLPAPVVLVAALRRVGVIPSSAAVRVEAGRWATGVHVDETNWIVREVPTPSSVSILTIDREIEGRSPDLGMALASAPDETVWRLERETDVKDLLSYLARQSEHEDGSADTMATVLALFQTGGASERALLQPPQLISDLGIPEPILTAVEPPRLVFGQDRADSADWTLAFWSLASLRAEDGWIRSVLHRWTVTSRSGEVAWWSRPEWP